MSNSIIQMSDNNKGETAENEGEKSKKSKKSSKSKTKFEEREIYFIISYPRNEKETPSDLVFLEECEISPETIFIKEIKTSNNKYLYKKVFKYKNNRDKKEEILSFSLGKEDIYKYIISFNPKEKSFIYDVVLKKGHKYLDNIAQTLIKQDIMDYQDKLDLFIEALKENKEEKKKQELFQETIDLYSEKKGFSFLISLFVKVYQEKDLCNILIQNFYDMNTNIKGNEKGDGNTVRDPKLGEKFNSIMAKISSESDSLIKKNDYDQIQFYGIIICYLNFYDYSTFENYIDKLYKEKPEILYEILIVYFSHFLKPVKKEEKDKKFYVNFFEYIISKKEFSYFNIGLKFIFDIDTFIIVIDTTSDKIYNKYIKDNKNNFKPIQIKDNLTLKKEKINDIIKGIKNVNKFSDEKRYY